MYIFHIALEYVSSVIIFLNANALFFLMLSQQLGNPDAILWEFWFSGSLHPWLILHSLAEGASSWTVSLVSFIWIQFAYGFLTICLMCAIFAVYLCRKSSADPLWDLHADIYLDERKMLNIYFHLGRESSELPSGALLQAVAGQDWDASQTDQIIE